MTLREYLDHYGVAPAVFARKVGVRPEAIYRLLRGGKSTPSLRLALAIEKQTDGKVTSKELLNV